MSNGDQLHPKMKRQLQLILGYPAFFTGFPLLVIQIALAVILERDLSTLGVAVAVGLMTIGIVALFPDWPPCKIITRHLDSWADKKFGDDGFDAEGNLDP